MIYVNSSGIPMDEVFPVFMQNLPLRTDFDENEAVYKCFGHLYQQGHPLLKQNITQIITMAIGVLHTKQVSNLGKVISYLTL